MRMFACASDPRKRMRELAVGGFRGLDHGRLVASKGSGRPSKSTSLRTGA